MKRTLAARVNPIGYANWAERTCQIGRNGTGLRVWVPDERTQDWLEYEYAGYISEALATIGGLGVQCTRQHENGNRGALCPPDEEAGTTSGEIARANLEPPFRRAYSSLASRSGLSCRSARSSLPMVSARTSNTRCLRPSFLVLPRANGALHQHQRALDECTGVFRQRGIQNDAVPSGMALLCAVAILPGFLGGDRQRGHQRSVLGLVNFRILAGKADHPQLIHRVHVFSVLHFCPECLGLPK
jgi:hypothetical protein